MASSPLRDPFEALGDENRRAILGLLKERASSVQQIADQLPISRPAVSRHLKLLREAGLVSERRVGTRHLFQLDDAGVDAVRSYIEQMWGDTIARFRLVAENTAETPGEGEA